MSRSLLWNTITVPALGPGASVTLPHDILDQNVPTAPNFVLPERATPLRVVALTDTTITIQNPSGNATLATNFLVELTFSTQRDPDAPEVFLYAGADPAIGGGGGNLQAAYDAGPTGDIALSAAVGGVRILDNVAPLAVPLFSVVDSAGAVTHFSVTPAQTLHPAGSAAGVVFAPGVGFASDTDSGLALGFGTEIDLVLNGQGARFQAGDTWLNVVAGLFESFDSSNGGRFLADGAAGAASIALQGIDNAGQVEWYNAGSIDLTLARTAAQTVTLSSTLASLAATMIITADALDSTTFESLFLRNTTAATGGVPKQYSPVFALEGRGWTGAASQNVKIGLQMQPTDGGGNSPTADLAVLHSTNAGAYTQLIRVKRFSTNPAAPGARIEGDTSTAFLQLSSFGGTTLGYGTDLLGFDSVAANAISVLIGGTEQVRFTSTGVFRNMIAGNETAAATGGAVAIPVLARGFLSFVDSGGTTRKIAYFDV